MSELTITATGDRTFGVQADEAGVTTSHLVRVPDDFLDDLALGDDERYFPEDRAEIVCRLT